MTRVENVKTMRLAFWFCFVFCLSPFNVSALELMLPKVYSENTNVSGWLMSEKLDGVRGYWDGERLLSKNGLPFHPQAEFIKDLPPFPLEGEIWAGRGTFEKTMAIVGRQYPHVGWLELQFAIFDVPLAVGGTEKRLSCAKKWFADHPSSLAFVIPQQNVASHDQLMVELRRIESLGGEGLIVRRGDALYHGGRSGDILKVKSFFDMEAVVIGHLEGKGRNKGRLGALLVELPNQIRFKIGTGFSDAERQNPPPLGSVITFKYYGFLKSGIPKFASFLRVREGEDSP